MTSQRVDTLLASSILVFLILSYISQVTTTPTSLDSDRKGTEDDIDWLLQPVSLTSDNQNNDDIRLDAIKKDFPVTPIARKLKETPKESKLNKTTKGIKQKKKRRAKNFRKFGRARQVKSPFTIEAKKLNVKGKITRQTGPDCIHEGKAYPRGNYIFSVHGMNQCLFHTCQEENIRFLEGRCEDSSQQCHKVGTKWWDKDCVSHFCLIDYNITSYKGCKDSSGKCHDVASKWLDKNCVSHMCSDNYNITSNKKCKDSSGKCHEVGSEWLDKDCVSHVCGNDHSITSNKVCEYNGTCYRAESRWIDYNKCDHYQCIMKNNQLVSQIVYPAAYTCKTAIKYKPGSVESERKVVCGCPETYELFPESNNLTPFYYLLPL